MNWIKHCLLVSLCMVWAEGQLIASASYQASVSQRLEIYSIGTRSVFEHQTPISSGVPGFTITVDPLFVNPTLQVTRTVMTSGFGDYDASANAPLELTAENPFGITVGDSVKGLASVDGIARNATTSDSFVKTIASAHTTLFLVNRTDVEVFVDVVCDRFALTNESYENPPGDLSSARVELTPCEGSGDAVDAPRVFSVPPGTTRELDFGVLAFGDASAAQVIPEPASIAIWGILSVLALVTRERCKILHWFTATGG